MIRPASGRAVLLVCDCDGVLIDSEPLAAEAMSAVLSAQGIMLSPERLMHELTGLSQADILAGVAERTGKPIPLSVAGDVWPATRALFAQRLRAMAGAAAFLDTWTDPLCVASSSKPERILFSLERTGLLRFFAGRCFSSAQVAHGKPAPDLFLYAAAECGADPTSCVVVEDSVAGIRAAKAARMRAIGFTGGGHATPASAERLLAAGADVVVASWSEVAGALR